MRHPEWQRLRASASEARNEGDQKQQTQQLKYNDRMHKESNAPEPGFTKSQRGQGEGPKEAKGGVGPDMKSKSNAEKLVDKEPQAQAARELNEAMKQSNERGYRGYS